MRAREGLAGYSGLQHCGSVWACPVCASRILVHRGLEIGSVLGEAVRQGYALGFVTLTMRHRVGDRLVDLWDAAGRAWRRAITGKGWRSASDDVVGWVRVWEVTHGRNGWHVHVHAVLVLRPGADLDRIGSGMFTRWEGGLRASGYSALRRGQDWHVAAGEAAGEALGEYLAKAVAVVDGADPSVGDALGLELTHGRSGRSRVATATRSVWRLLDDLVATGEIGPWREWERASKGRRQVGWSVGLRERFGPAESLTDDEIVAEEVGDEDDTIVRWTADEWRVFVLDPRRPVQLLEAAEQGGLPLVRALFDLWGDVPGRVRRE